MKTKSKSEGGKKTCPCIENPFEECYCNHMNSQKVEDILHYCNGDYWSCDTFRKRIDEVRMRFPAVINYMVLES